ncbi:MAG TPA: lipid II flippase MurJ [Actinomycetes bacterium]
MSARRAAAGLAGAAMVIAAVTVVSRVVGFGRWLVFSETVQASCLGTAYSTANMLPNIIFEVVAGGALASAVVPLVGGRIARGDPAGVRQTSSALLGWVLVVLVPLAAVVMLLSGPLMGLLAGEPQGCDETAVADVATRMFVVFAPQIPLYGVAVVCGGILNAHRRFLAAAAAPLVSTAVVITTYLAFGAGYDGSRDDLAGLPIWWERTLSLGTTGGVVVLMLTMAVPVAGLRLGLRPTLRFPDGVAPQARRLALAGLAGLVAQQLSVLVVIMLANREGGALNVYQYAWAVYLVPYAVLAVPIATSAFTALSEHAGREDVAAFRDTAARTTRAVVIASAAGAAALAGTAAPVGRTFLSPQDGPPPWQLAWALVAFAPGLVGYGLVAHLGRVLYARHLGRAAAVATVAGWVVVAVASAVLVLSVPVGWTVTAIGAANSAGMLLAGGLLVVALTRRVGAAALAGVPRAALAGAGGALLGAAGSAGLAALIDVDGKVANGLVACLAGLVAFALFAVVVLAVDGDDLQALLRRRARRG